MKAAVLHFGDAGKALSTAGNGRSLGTLRAAALKLEKVCRSYRKKRRGAAVVEFATVAPVFILPVFGKIEFGRTVMVQQILTNASRGGARQAALDGATEAEVTTVVEDFLASSSDAGAIVTVTPSPASDAAFGEPVTVSVDVPFSQVN